MTLGHGVAPRYAPRAALYLLKLAAFEPFRLWEALRPAYRLPPDRALFPEAPVFILGYYRSGTTHLQECLLQDPRAGYLNFYQCFFPTAFRATESWLRGPLDRIVRAAGFLHPAHQVPFHFGLPGEEDVALVASGHRLAANWGQVLPNHFRRIYERTGLLSDISSKHRAALQTAMMSLFRKVAHANGRPRQVFKSPPQTGRIPLLLEMFPKARFVFIRRDPFAVYKSNLKLWRSFCGQHLQSPSPDAVREAILWSYDAVHEAYLRDRAQIPRGQLVEVSYEDFQAAPLRIIAHIYRDLALPGFLDAQAPIRRYLAAHHQPQRARYTLEPSDVAAIEARWGRWLDEWHYRARKAA